MAQPFVERREFLWRLRAAEKCIHIPDEVAEKEKGKNRRLQKCVIFITLICLQKAAIAMWNPVWKEDVCAQYHVHPDYKQVLVPEEKPGNSKWPFRFQCISVLN